jgi:septal ring factor EnvC (AmiA/AmiB activator)
MRTRKLHTRIRKRRHTQIRKRIISRRRSARRSDEYVGGNSLQQKYNACMKLNKSLEERLAKTEDLLLTVVQELNELRRENAELREKLAKTEEKLAKTEDKLKVVYQKFYEDKIITSVFDVMKYEKHAKKNPLFQNVIMKNLKNNRHDTNHYILEKDTVELVKKKELYLQELIQDLLDVNSPMIEHVNDKVYDMSGNTLYDMLAAIKLNVEQNQVVLTPEDRATLDDWWNKS